MKIHALVPSREDFVKKASGGNLIPVYREIFADLETPVSAFKKVDDGGDVFLFESVEQGENWGRYSFIGINPVLVFKSKGNQIEIIQDGASTTVEGEPIEHLRQILSLFQPVRTEGLPRFYGGLVGYFSYDMVRFFENLPQTSERDVDFYDCFFVVPETVLVFDNVSHTIKVIANVFVRDGEALTAYDRAAEKIDRVVDRLKSPLSRDQADESLPPSASSGTAAGFTSNFSRDEFLSATRKIKAYIRDGDVIQTVLSQRFETKLDVDPFDIYRALRVINPSPYMFYLRLEDTILAGSSPEILVRADHGQVMVRPIAGTRHRGRDEREDKELEKDLLADPKERAEHVMLVDLGRNDIGRVARTGSVTVDELMAVERYSHVMHIVSNVSGILQDGEDSFSALKACFPAGTLSGAPKVRAMEIIEELEPNRRGIYGGSVGYFSFSGNMDMCIAIRTMVIKGDRVFAQAGAGIVADSVPESEYEETVNKSRALFKAIELARQGLE